MSDDTSSMNVPVHVPPGHVVASEDATVATAVLFFAYVSLFKRRELMETPLGRVVCGCVALFYLEGAVTGAVERGFDPVDLVVFSAIAFLYLFVAAPRRPGKAKSAAPVDLLA